MLNTAKTQGPTAARLARNVKEVRKGLGLDLATLSTRLTDVGWPIGLAQLSKLELGQRRVDADDLVALAVALDVTPARLLLDSEADDEPLSITPNVTMTKRAAWEWSAGETPLPSPGIDLDLDRLGDFTARNAPHVERDEMTLKEIERNEKALRPIAKAASAARARGIPHVSIEGYLRLAKSMEEMANRGKH